MTQFERHGFLDTEARQQHAVVALARHEPYFQVLKRASEVAMNLLHQVQHKGQDQFVAALIFAKMIKAAQATVILCEAALPNEAAAIGRGVVEAAIALAAIRQRPGQMLSTFEEDDAQHSFSELGARLDYAHAYKPVHSDDPTLTKADQAAHRKRAKEEHRKRRDRNITWLEARRADILARYKREPRPIAWSTLAQQAGATAIYNMSYRRLSAVGTHTTLLGLDPLLRKSQDGKDGKDEGIFFSPLYGEIPSVLFHTAQGFIFGMFAAGTVLDLGTEDDPRMMDLVEEFINLDKNFLDQEIPD